MRGHQLFGIACKARRHIGSIGRKAIRVGTKGARILGHHPVNGGCAQRTHAGDRIAQVPRQSFKGFEILGLQRIHQTVSFRSLRGGAFCFRLWRGLLSILAIRFPFSHYLCPVISANSPRLS